MDINQRSEALQILAESILNLITHENAIMMERGSLTLENIMGHKANLLEKIEQLLDGCDHEKIDNDTLNVILSLKKAIKLNTSLQQAQFLQDQHMMNGLKSKLLDNMSDRNDICHH